MARPRAPGAITHRLLFAVALVVHLTVLYAPAPDVPGTGVPGVDKVTHVLVFATLTWAGLWAGLARRWFVPAVLAHAVVSELVQAHLLAGRAGDPWDAVADVVGVALGVLAHRRRRRPSPSTSPHRSASAHDRPGRR